MRNLNHYHREATFRFANGAAGASLTQEIPLPCAGEILSISQQNDNNTNNVTAQLLIKNYLGQTIWDGTAKAENQTHLHEFVNTRRCICGNDKLVCVISGDPGASGAKIDVVISLFGRDA